ncbi:hypothetical protein LJC07_07790, partial [Christensenellaceae bacterium OttesenSCG-928-L17]|nr:hypothetical protein [Christensenellaceae bacterium OttesenSCG-928-L17]
MKPISKSDFMMFLKHPAWLWLRKHDPDKIPPVDEQAQALFDAGFLFESYAEKLFPGAVRLGFNNFNEYSSLPLRTEQAISSGAKVLLQARFEKDGYTCISDVIEILDNKLFNLYEIKSSSSVKPEHSIDLAFQVMVIESLGYKINQINVIHVNSEYVRNGEIDPRQLSTTTDMTEQVRSQAALVATEAPHALAIVNSDVIPDPSPSLTQLGAFGEYMRTFRNLKELPEYSIYDLVTVGAARIGKLEELGILEITEIPDDFEGLTAKQQAQIEATKRNRPLIDSDKIKEFLGKLKYPLYFLDYETYSSVIPFFD